MEGDVFAHVLNSSIGKRKYFPKRTQGGVGIGYLPDFFFGFALVAFFAQRQSVSSEKPM